MAGARRHAWEEEESEPGRERRRRKREGGLSRGIQGLQGVFSASRRQAGGGLGSALHRTRSSSLPTGRRKQFFAENPLGFERFHEKNRNCTLCNILYFKWCAEILKFGRDFLEK
jgi:hypothetical protein